MGKRSTGGLTFILGYGPISCTFLLYEIKQHDRLAISKLVTKLTRGTISSPLATCLLIRYITTIVRDSGGNALASATGRAAYQFLELSLRHRSEAVIYEAAKALCNLPGIEERDLGPAVAVLQLFLSSPKSTLRLACELSSFYVAIANHQQSQNVIRQGVAHRR